VAHMHMGQKLNETELFHCVSIL